MFKKIVSQLSFSPALVGQLGFYARRLRKEQFTRRLGMVFMALALVVQSLVVFQAPEPANAASNGDMIYGGLGYDFNKLMGPYDRNEKNLRDIFNNFGITRDELTSAKFGSYKVNGNHVNHGFANRSGSRHYAIVNEDNTHVTNIYARNQNTLWKNGSKIEAWIGYSAKAGWFAIMNYCGNLVTDKYLTQVPPPAKPPLVSQPIAPPAPPLPPPTPSIPPAKLEGTKTGVNVTQGKADASKVIAKADDKVTYTISIKNTGGMAGDATFSDDLSKVLIYSKLIDKGGGTFDTNTNLLSWPKVSVQPGATISKSYTVQLNNSLVTAQTDCKMTNTFMANTVIVPVGCTTPPANIVTKKTAVNVTQGNVDATTVIAQAKDRITFTLTAENTGGTAKEFSFEDTVDDTLEYAQIVENGGGTLSENKYILNWPIITLAPGAKEVRTFQVQILDVIPSSPKGVSDPSSYNCKIENVFYESFVNIDVNCPAPKVIEQVVPELPQTGPRENMLFAGILATVVLYFYLRSRQLGTEVRLIRRDLNGGAI